MLRVTEAILDMKLGLAMALLTFSSSVSVCLTEQGICRIGAAAEHARDQERAKGGGISMDENKLLERVTFNPKIFGGKPIIRGRRLAVEHVVGMLASGDSEDTILRGYPWLEREDIQACLAYAHRVVGHERIEPLNIAEQTA